MTKTFLIAVASWILACGIGDNFYVSGLAIRQFLHRSNISYVLGTSQTQTREALGVSEESRPSMSSPLEMLSMISDDDHRRRAFQSFLLDGLFGEVLYNDGGLPKQEHVHEISWSRECSPFAQNTRKRLMRLATAVQYKAWEKYVIQRCTPPTAPPPQLWSCVDMTVQLEKFLLDFEHCFQTNKDIK